MTQIILIALGGPSSSGKTSCSNVLQSVFPNSKLIHQDDFYLDDDKIPLTPSGQQNWDCAEAIDFVKFKKYLNCLKEGDLTDLKSIEPDSTLKLTTEELTSLKKTVQDADLKDTTLIFVDGFMLFHDLELIKLFDISLFFYAAFETLQKRREGRSGYITTSGFWVDPPNYFRDVVWPGFVDNHKHLFVNGDVDGKVDLGLLKRYSILGFENDEGKKLIDLGKWSVQRILERVSGA